MTSGSDPQPVPTHAQARPPEPTVGEAIIDGLTEFRDSLAACRCGWKGQPTTVPPVPGCLPIFRCPDCARQATNIIITDRDAGDESK